MTVTNTSISNFGPLVQKTIEKSLEEALRASLPFLSPGNWSPAIAQSGTSAMLFVAVADISANVQTLAEGVPPTPDALALDYETCTPVQCGHTVELTDRLQILSPFDMVTQATEKLARLAKAEADLIARAGFEECTNVFYINGSNNSSVSATLTGAAVKLMYGRLANKNVPKFPDGMYHAIISPRQAYDLKADTATGSGWMDVNKYTDTSNLLANELGSFAGFRFMESTICTSSTTAAGGGKDLLSGYYFGPHPIGFGGLDSTRTYVVLGPDKSDPLNQLGYVGYKSYLGAKYLAKAGDRCAVLRVVGTVLAATGEV